MRGQLELLDHGLLSEALEIERQIVGGEEKGAAGDDADGLVASVAECVDRYKREATSSGRQFVRTKNLVEFRRTLINEFLKSCMQVTKCPHCSAPVRKVRQEQRVRVFLKGLSKKQATAWAAAKSKENSHQRLAERVLSGERREETEEDEPETARVEMFVSESADKLTEQSYVSPLAVRQHLRELWLMERLLMDAIFSCSRSGGTSERNPADMFFLSVIPVPPSRFRPVSLMDLLLIVVYPFLMSHPSLPPSLSLLLPPFQIATMGERRFENPQTANLARILADTIAIHELMVAKEQEGEEEGRGKKGPVSCM